MRKHRLFILLESAAMLLVLASLLVAVLWTSMPMRDTVLLGLWVLILLLSFCLMAHSHRALADAMGFRSTVDAQMATLTKTLMTAETAIADKDQTLAQNKTEISRLSESNSMGKQQISILRNEVGSLKTRLEEVNQLLRRLMRRAEMSDKLKSALVANINDELRNPLNSIMGYTSLLRNSAISESRRAEYIDIVTRDSKRFLDALNDIFYYSKLMVGDVEPVATTFNVNTLLQNSVQVARQQVAELGRNIEIRLHQASGNGFVGGYEPGYVKILASLLGNAVKFTREGYVDVQCVVDVASVKISVEDTGVGFDSGSRELIFDAFQQADITLARKYQGTGLGLAISRTLARLMGGDIVAESHEGAGSRFSVEIPLSAVSETNIQLYDKVQKLLGTGQSRGRVLVITPINDDFDFINRFMTNYNIDVVRSWTAEETDTLVREYPDISMAIIDLYSWSLEGVEAAERIFRQRPGIRFAFISNGMLEPLQIETIRAYTDIILGKPITSAALSQALQKWYL